MIRLKKARISNPRIALASLMEVNGAFISGFNARTATLEDVNEFCRITNVLWDCCDALETLIAEQEVERVS